MNPASGTNPAARAPAAPMAGARLSLILLLLVNLFNYIDRYVLAAVEPLIAKDVLSPTDKNQQAKMGLLATAFMISYMLTAPVFGWLGDRVKRWKLIGIGVLLWTIASGASGLSHRAGLYFVSAGVGWITGFTVLLVTRCFVGVGEGAYGPVAPSLISDMYPVERRGSVLSWFYIAIPVGSSLGYVLGGQIGTHLGWQWAFYSVVPPGLALGLWCLFLREPKRGASDCAGDPGATRSALANYKLLFRTPSYLLNVAGMTAMTFAVGGVSFWMPRYIAEFRKAAPLESATWYFGIITASTGILATLTGGWLGDRLRNRYPGSYFLVSGGAMLLGFPLFLGVMFTPFPYCWGIIALAVFCLFFNTGPTNTIVANVTHPSVRSSAFALCILVIHLFGDAISPAIIGAVSDQTGGNMNAGFGVVSGMVLIAGLLWLWGARYLAADTARASRGSASLQRP